MDKETSSRVIVAGWGFTIPGIEESSQNGNTSLLVYLFLYPPKSTSIINTIDYQQIMLKYFQSDVIRFSCTF